MAVYVYLVREESAALDLLGAHSFVDVHCQCPQQEGFGGMADGRRK